MPHVLNAPALFMYPAPPGLDSGRVESAVLQLSCSIGAHPSPLLTGCWLFQIMDVESAGGLDALEMCNGMRKLVREPGGGRRGGRRGTANMLQRVKNLDIQRVKGWRGRGILRVNSPVQTRIFSPGRCRTAAQQLGKTNRAQSEQVPLITVVWGAELRPADRAVSGRL